MAYQQDGNFSMAANNVLQNNAMDTSYGQPNQQNQASFNLGGGNPGLAHYVNQLNYNNSINQNQLYQQHSQLETQNQQLNQMQTEQENLKRQLAMQRQFAQQARSKVQAPSSRQKEANALLMLDNFQRSLNGGGGNLASMFENNELLTQRRRQSKAYSFNNFPPSREKPPTSYARANIPKEPEPYQNYQTNVHQSPFQNAANMMINPMSPGMYPPNYSPYPQGWVDPFGMQQQSPYPQEPKKESSSKTAEILMASLEKQNMILSELTGSINRDRDHKVVQEAKEIENKIRQMEFESQAKQYQLLTQNTSNSLGSNYNRPLVDVNLQKHNDLTPGMLPNLISPLQMVQLQSIMNSGNNPFGFGGAQPTFSALPNEFMQHQKALEKYKEKQKKKDKKKKNKLKELLLLLGLEDDDEEGGQVVEVEAQQEPTQGKSKKSAKKQKDKEQEVVNQALNEEIAKLEDEKKKKDEEEFLKKRKRRTQAMLWTRLYPILFYVDFYERKGAEREDSHQQLSEKIGINMDNTKGWVTKSAMKGFEMVINNAKLNLAIVPFGGKKLNAKDLETRPAEIQKILKTLMDGLINNTKEGVIPSQLVNFLGEISQDYMYVPQNYLFAFETNRLNFTHNASLKETTPPKTQMICALFVLVRAFIAELLLQPDKVIGSAKITDTLMRNLKTLASILVIAIIEFLRSRVLVQNGNQNHLDVELKIKPRSTPIAFNCPVDIKDDPDEEGAKNKKKDETETLIKDMYTKEQLSTYFGKKNLVDELKALVEGWCNSMGTIVGNNHEEERKKRLANKKKT